MKILYYDLYDTRIGREMNVRNFGELEHHGHSIEYIYNHFHYPSDEDESKLLAALKNKNYDLFVTSLDERYVSEDVLIKIKSMGIPMLLHSFDSIYTPYMFKNICKHFDLMWIYNSVTVPLLKKWGANIMVAPPAANPYYFKPYDGPEIPHVGLVGAPYSSRVSMINDLTESGVDVTVHYGDGAIKRSNEATSLRDVQKGRLLKETMGNLIRFKIGRKMICSSIKQRIQGGLSLNTDTKYFHPEPRVSWDEYSSIMGKYGLALTSTYLRNTGILKRPEFFLTFKCFEIPMQGGIIFTQYSEELASYFEEDKEAIYFRTPDEMVEKAQYYLDEKRCDTRLKIKKAARLRAESEHTWFKRYDMAFKRLGLS